MDYAPLHDLLKSMGYQTGLTMHALPYDFTRGVMESNNYNKILTKLLKRSLEISGKRAIITSHSFGGLMTYYGLLNME